MYRTVVVALDGSPLAERALPYARALAWASGARLALVRAAAVPTVADLDAFEEHLAAARAEAEAYLRAAVRRLGAQAPRLAGRTAAVAVPVRHGSVAEALRQTAREQEADVLVLATHGRSGLGRWLYGSVADDVLRHADVPVLLVPAAAARLWPPDAGQWVLVPLDGSALAQEVIPAAAELAAVLRADLHLLRVVGPPASVVGWGDAYATIFDPAAGLVEATEYLEGVAATLRARGLAVRVSAEVGPEAPTIAAVAEEQRASVIAMATHGRSGLARLVLGSVATGVVQLADVPLLLVRPAAVRQPDQGAGADAVAAEAPKAHTPPVDAPASAAGGPDGQTGASGV
jgi:nucleotide-binding universal stress UspA family protein